MKDKRPHIRDGLMDHRNPSFAKEISVKQGTLYRSTKDKVQGNIDTNKQIFSCYSSMPWFKH